LDGFKDITEAQRAQRPEAQCAQCPEAQRHNALDKQKFWN